MTNINGNQNWDTCFMAGDVDLPTGYYFGFSAATGDLAGAVSLCLVCHTYLIWYLLCTDNHDIITVRAYDVDVEDKKDPAAEVRA